MKTIADALAELHRRRPVSLNVELAHVVAGEPRSLKFSDEHEFVVPVPAWVFRAIEEEMKIRSQS